MVLNSHILSKTLAGFRWIFIQKLIILIISMLLAMCLGYATLVMVLHYQSMQEVTSATRQDAVSAADLEDVQVSGKTTDWTQTLRAGREEASGRLLWRE